MSSGNDNQKIKEVPRRTKDQIKVSVAAPMAKASHPYDFDRFEPSGLPHYDVTYLEMGRPGLWRRPCKLTDNIKEIPYSVLCILPSPRLIDHQARQPFNTTTAIGIDFRHKRSYDISRSPDLGLISTSSSLPTCGRGANWHHPWFKAWLYPSILSTCPEPRRRTKRRRMWLWRRARLHQTSDHCPN